MGNVWCFTPKRYIIDYTQRKFVVSQGIQCTLLTTPIGTSSTATFSSTPTCCANTTNNTASTIIGHPNPICTTDPHHHHHSCTHCGSCGPGGDTLNCHALNCCFTSCNPCNIKDTTAANNYQPIINYKSQKSINNYDLTNNTPDALVSLSETFSQTSLEEFLERKRSKQNIQSKKRSTNSLTIQNDRNNNKTENSNQQSHHHHYHNNNYNEFSDHKQSKKRNHSINHKRNHDYNLQNDHNSETLSNLSCSTIENLNELTSPVVPNPKKSILKISQADNENKVLSKHLSRSMSFCNEKFNHPNTNIVHRSASALSSNHDSIDQFLQILKSDNKILPNDDCNTGKNVNFLNADVMSNASTTPMDNKLSDKFTKTNIIKLPDGRIKKRFLLRETHKLFDILDDPKDRRIRAICDRYQCDMEIFVKPPKIGLMHFAIEILAPDRYSLRMCVRELDSSMRWCISSQMF